MFHYEIIDSKTNLVLASSKYEIDHKGYDYRSQAINAAIDFKEKNNFNVDCNIKVI